MALVWNLYGLGAAERSEGFAAVMRPLTSRGELSYVRARGLHWRPLGLAGPGHPACPERLRTKTKKGCEGPALRHRPKRARRHTAQSHYLKTRNGTASMGFRERRRQNSLPNAVNNRGAVSPTIRATASSVPP